MNVFELRRHVVADYANYTRSFIRVKDAEICPRVDDELDGGLLWPEPLIQLNPSFEPGAWIDDLVKEMVLHPECSNTRSPERLDQSGILPLNSQLSRLRALPIMPMQSGSTS